MSPTPPRSSAAACGFFRDMTTARLLPTSLIVTVAHGVIRREPIVRVVAAPTAPVALVPRVRGWEGLRDAVRGEFSQYGIVDAAESMVVPDWRSS